MGQRSPRSLAATRSRVRTRRPLLTPPYSDGCSDISVLLGCLKARERVPGSVPSPIVAPVRSGRPTRVQNLTASTAGLRGAPAGGEESAADLRGDFAGPV